MKWIDHYESQIAINSVSYHGVNDHSNKEQANRLKRGQTWVTKPLFILVLYPINFSESNTQRRSKTKAIRSNVWQLTGNCPTFPPPGIAYIFNFRPFTCAADYPRRSIFAITRKKFQQITRTQIQKKIVDLHKVTSLFLWTWYPLACN